MEKDFSAQTPALTLNPFPNPIPNLYLCNLSFETSCQEWHSQQLPSALFPTFEWNKLFRMMFIQLQTMKKKKTSYCLVERAERWCFWCVGLFFFFLLSVNVFSDKEEQKDSVCTLEICWSRQPVLSAGSTGSQVVCVLNVLLRSCVREMTKRERERKDSSTHMNRFRDIAFVRWLILVLSWRSSVCGRGLYTEVGTVSRRDRIWLFKINITQVHNWP